MALLTEDGGRETYPRVRSASSGVGTTTPAPVSTQPAPEPTQPPASEPAPPPATPQTYGLSGFDTTKLNDPNHNSFKYQFARIARKYNPQQGVQSGMLDELNKLGYGSFYGSGQHLGYRGITDAGRAAGLDPYDFEGDFIQGYQGGQNPNAMWQYDAWAPPNPSQQVYGDAQMPDFSALLTQQPQAPVFQFTNTGIDPAVLQSLLAMVQPQAPQQVMAPGYQPSAPQTQAAPMPQVSGAQSGGSSVQTQTAPAGAQGIDPFMAWLRQQVFGGANARV